MIIAEHLRKTFPGKGKDKTPVVAVDDVGFEARDGEITGLLGPNGAGKTTTLRLCLGLTAPDSGEVRLLGADVVAVAGVEVGPTSIGISRIGYLLPQKNPVVHITLVDSKNTPQLIVRIHRIADKVDISKIILISFLNAKLKCYSILVLYDERIRNDSGIPITFLLIFI